MSTVCIESGFSNDEVLNIRFPLHRACRDGDVGALCSILQRTTNQSDLVTEDSFYGWTPIHWASHFGKLECVMRLVQVGCEVNAMTTRFAQTPAHIAAFGGHPDCVLWLLQAGADINRQDYVGESPIHKAARAGSMECVNALLIRGAKPDLRNANGLTAADLAQAQGFQECALLLSNAHNHVNQQFNGGGGPKRAPPPLPLAPPPPLLNGNGLCSGRGLLNGTANRKRMLDDLESDHIKKARTEVVFPDMNHSPRMHTVCGGEEPESMDEEAEPARANSQSGGSGAVACGPMATGPDQDWGSPTSSPPTELETSAAPVHIPYRCTNSYAYLYDALRHTANGHSVSNGNSNGHALPRLNGFTAAPRPNGLSSPWGLTAAPATDNEPSSQPANQGPAGAGGGGQRRRSSDMCGSLHQSGSPSTCVSHRPSWGHVANFDPCETLHYGHYHGFGDTAEDLTDSSRLEHSTSVRAEQLYNQEVISAMQLYHGS
ncbi:ankyrin repeat domain-containing protein 10a [Aplochiton taeniatus]